MVSSLSKLHDYTQPHHTCWNSSRLVISPTQRSLPNNIQHSQQTHRYAPDGTQTGNPSKRTAADPRLRLRGHWDRPSTGFFFFSGAATQRGSWPPHSRGFLDHTQRRTTVGRTPLDEWSTRRRDLYLTTHNTRNRQTSMPRWDSNPRSQKASGRRPTP